MKTFFSLPKSPDDAPYKKYVAKTLDENHQNQLDDIDNQLDNFVRKQSGFGILKTIGYILIIIASIAMIGRALGSEDLFNDGLTLSIVCFVAIGIGIALLVSSYIVLYKIKHNATKKELEDKYLELENNFNYELGAVDPLIDLDIYMPEVTLDEDKEDIANPLFHSCLNLPVKAFVDESKQILGIIYGLKLYSVPKSSIIKIEKIDKRIIISSWNKETPISSKEFKDLRVTKSSYGLSIKGYYKVIMKLDNEDYNFLIGSYDANEFAKLLNIEIA